MKRFLGFLIAVVLLSLAATPAFAQGPNEGDVVCFGDSTVVKDEAPNNVVLFGCGARIASGTQVYRDVVSFGGDVVLEEGAQVGRDVVVFGGNLDINGQVNHDVVAFGGRVTLEPGSVVQGDVVAFGPVTRKEGAVVHGTFQNARRIQIGPFRGVNPTTVPFGFAGGLAGIMANAYFDFLRGLINALAFAALGALTVIFLPAQTKQVADAAERSPMPSLGVGCLTMIAAIVLIPLLIVIIIGIPAAILVALAWAIAMAFGWIALGRLVGEKILEAFKVRDIMPVVAVVAGVLILAVLGAVPVIGWLISLVAVLIGVGAVVLSRFGTRPYPPAPSTAIVPTAPPAPPASTSGDMTPSI